MGALARDFKRRSRAQKAYISANLAGPLGVVLVFVGAGHDHVVLVIGIVLLGVFAIDTLLVFPILRARQDLRRKRSPDPS
jgi:hypothetical protein